MHGVDKHLQSDRPTGSCWLGPSVKWSFLGLVCAFISVNTIFLFLTVHNLRLRLASLNSNVSTLKNTRMLTFKALAQMFILGSTWIIGVFQFGSGFLVISYLFTICNSLQGAFIFLVHCLLNHQVQGVYRKLFCRRHICAKLALDESASGTLQTVPKSTNEPPINTEEKDSFV